MLHFRQVINEEFSGKEVPSAQRISADFRRLVEEMISAGAPGLRGAKILTQAYDLLVQEAYTRHRDRLCQPLAVMAVGGFGQRYFAPASDVDLLFLTKDAPHEDEPVVGALLNLLWDVAGAVSHKTIAVTDIGAVMRGDAAAATSFLNARLICGEEHLYLLFDNAVQGFFKANCDSFIAAKMGETEARHSRQNATVFKQQPDVKEAPGGLRDIQTIRWVGRALQLAGRRKSASPHPLISAEDAGMLEDSLDFLLSVRHVLHHEAGTKEDVLRLDVHPVVAERLGYEATAEATAAQNMMRDYYFHAGTAARTVRLMMASYERVEGTAKKRRVEQRRQLAGRTFTVVGKELFAATPAVFERAGGAFEMFRAFLLAQKHHVAISNELIKRIHDNLYRVDDNIRADATAAGMFLELLAGAGGASAVMRAMRDSGFLSAYIQPFGSIEGLVPDDPSHEYTVDEHTLFALGAIDGLAHASDTAAAEKRKIFERLPHPEVLNLAILLHDVGKGRGSAHAERGALMVPQVTEQLRMPESLARQVVFLVANHLLLNAVAGTRDTSDEKILAEIAEIAGSAEMLDYLYLLSFADASSVGVGAWPSWKDAVLYELYRKVSVTLAQGAVLAPQETDFRLALLAALPPDIAREDALLHVELVPPRYRLEVSVTEAIEHLRLIKEISEKSLPAAVTCVVKDNVGVIWVVSPDMPGRLAEIAGCISASGLAIQSATAHTRRDAVILDKFVATIPAGSLLTAPWETVRKNITAVLGGELTVGQLMAHHRSTLRKQRRTAKPRRIETIVTVDNRISDRYTVIDVVCEDRLGLLYDLTKTILASGLDIHFSRIATHGSMVTDVFYVTRTAGGRVEEEADKEKLLKTITTAIEGRTNAQK